MRYKCSASPYCLKTFEYGHALRAHVASCIEAQKRLKSEANVQKLENDIAYDNSVIQGFHTNPYFPTHHNSEKTEKFQFKDKYRFNGMSEKPEDFNNQDVIRPLRKSVPTSVMHENQVKSLLNYQA